MIILENIITIENLIEIAQSGFGEMVKAVVDVEKNLIALDAELHSDLEALLLENGSNQKFLWGINYYPEMEDSDFIEFDSMINLRPSHGNYSCSVDDVENQNRIFEISNHWIKRN